MTPVRRILTITLAVIVAALAVAPVDTAGAYPGAPWFRPAHPYTENFPDPSVLRVGYRYYAFGTATGGAYLPIMSSGNLVQWVARSAYTTPAQGGFGNDGLPAPASWAVDRPVGNRLSKEVWAPGAAQIGGRFVVYYAARVALDRARFCISAATSPTPDGPYTDSTKAPLWCDSDPNGSIDPQPFVDDDGTPYLLWKSEGDPGRLPTRIWIRRLAPDGLSFAPGSSGVNLLSTSQAWEGRVIENPSMVRWKGRLYLFYSGNEHQSGDYATGYAVCATPTSGCRKHDRNPILRSRGNQLGPGGASAFVDHIGQLRIAFHWWNAPYTSYPRYPDCERTRTCTTQGQRRMSVEPVFETKNGLVVGTTQLR
jgi:beta-xylosidase